MAWVKLDDQFFFKERTREAGKDGRALFFAGLCYCACNRTDGRIKASSLPLVAGLAEVEPDIAHLLADIGLWATTEEGFEVIDYLKYNPSRAQLEADAAAAAERQSRAKSRRDSHRENGVSPPAPSPLPSPDTSSSSSSTSDLVPAEVWDGLAKRKLGQAKGVNDTKAWCKRVIENDRLEHGERAAWIYETYDITASQLVDVLAAGGTSPLLNNLRKRATA